MGRHDHDNKTSCLLKTFNKFIFRSINASFFWQFSHRKCIVSFYPKKVFTSESIIVRVNYFYFPRSVEIPPTTHSVQLRGWPPLSPKGGGNPRGQVPLDPQFRSFFSDTCLRPCSTGRGSTDPERPWLHHYPILSLTGFLQSLKKPFLYRTPNIWSTAGVV